MGTYIALHSLVSGLVDRGSGVGSRVLVIGVGSRIVNGGDGHLSLATGGGGHWSGLGLGLGSMPCVVTVGWRTVPPGWAG